MPCIQTLSEQNTNIERSRWPNLLVADPFNINLRAVGSRTTEEVGPLGLAEFELRAIYFSRMRAERDADG